MSARPQSCSHPGPGPLALPSLEESSLRPRGPFLQISQEQGRPWLVHLLTFSLSPVGKTLGSDDQNKVALSTLAGEQGVSTGWLFRWPVRGAGACCHCGLQTSRRRPLALGPNV